MVKDYKKGERAREHAAGVKRLASHLAHSVRTYALSKELVILISGCGCCAGGEGLREGGARQGACCGHQAPRQR